EGTLQAGTSAVSDKLLDLVGLGGKSAADKGKDTRDYLAAAFPELNAWERAGADASSAGMVDAGFENQKELTKMQLDNRSEERFSRNAETDLVCRLLLEKKNRPLATKYKVNTIRHFFSRVAQLTPPASAQHS